MSEGGSLGIGFVDVLPRTEKFVGSLQKQMSSAFGGLQKSLGGASALTTGLQLGFVALGGVAVHAITEGIHATQEWASEVRAMQRTTGQTAESASALLAVTERLGIDSSTAARSFALFAKNVVTNNKALGQYGVVTRDATGQLLPFDELLGNVADSVSALPPGLAQASAAKQLFGRAGVALLPLLQKESAGIEELMGDAKALGLVMSQDDVDAAKDLTIAQNEWGSALKGASISIGKDFIPAATKMVEIGTKVIEMFTAIPGPIKDVIFGLTALTGLLAGLNIIVRVVTSAWGPLVGAVQAKVVADTEVAVSSTVAAGAMEEESVAATTLTGRLAAAAGASKLFSGSALAIVGQIAVLASAVIGFGIGVDALWRDMGAGAKEAEDRINGFLLQLQFGTHKQIAAVKDLANQTRITSLDQANSLGISRAAALETNRDIAAAQAATAQAAENAGQTSQDVLSGLFENLDQTTTKLVDVPNALNAIMGPLRSDFKELSDLSQSTGADFESVGADLQKALQDPALTIGKLPDLFANTIGAMKSTMQDFRASIVDALGGAGSALEDFADKNKVSLSKATGALRGYTKDVRSFGSDLLSLHKEQGKSSEEFVSWATQQGLAQQGLVSAVASANKKDQESFLRAFNTGQTAGETFAKELSNVLSGAFDKILNDFKRMWNQILIALGRAPVFKIDTSDATSKLTNLYNLALKTNAAVQGGKSTGAPPPKPFNPNNASTGGLVTSWGVQHFARGGKVKDIIPAMLAPGEFVLTPDGLQRLGLPNAIALNKGGRVSAPTATPETYSARQSVQQRPAIMQIYDWRTGLASLETEQEWEDAVRTR